METPLEKIIKEIIHRKGPMDIGSFMSLALTHPEFGYYTNRDPFGIQGDFITAPEISQMFGELIGAWSVNIWQQMGRPKKFALCECGPGRGTLMQDAIRSVGKRGSGFLESMQIHLIETSPKLKELQRRALEGRKIKWHKELPKKGFGMPVILIANEFLDALPVRQIIRTSKGWRERHIDWNEGRGFQYVHKPLSKTLLDFIPTHSREYAIYEISPARAKFFSSICNIILENTGAALLLDYGYTMPEAGETLQAVYRHSYTNVFDNIGNNDLTAHVDFHILEKIAHSKNLKVYGAVSQGSFLMNLGIFQRAEMLKEYVRKNGDSNSATKQIEKISQDLLRLTSPFEMGELFKVLCVTQDKANSANGFTITPEGF